MLYDSLLVIALLMMATMPFIAVRGGEPVEAGSDPLYPLTMLAVCWAFFAGFWSKSGRTLGMQSWRLLVQDANGMTPGILQASLRFGAAILSLLPFGLGFWWQLWDRDNLAWHDRLSSTRLVYFPKEKSG